MDHFRAGLPGLRRELDRKLALRDPGCLDRCFIDLGIRCRPAEVLDRLKSWEHQLPVGWNMDIAHTDKRSSRTIANRLGVSVPRTSLMS